MGGGGNSRTHVTLLQRLAHSGEVDQGAWKEFVEQYGRTIYRWCKHQGLQEADARDVTQQVLLKIAANMKRFVYDPGRSFRAWLYTLVRNALADFHTDRRPDRGTGDSAVLGQLQTVEARVDLEQQLEAEYDRELLERAMLRVRLRVAPHTWEAFQLTALEGLPVHEAAVRLNMKIASVYQARTNVRKKLQEEREALETGQAAPLSATGGRR